MSGVLDRTRSDTPQWRYPRENKWPYLLKLAKLVIPMKLIEC
jgi:hypothetical protein